MAWILLLVAVAALVAFRQFNKVNVDHLPQSFVVFDLKTTGPDPDRHEIIEIGAIRVDRDSTVHDSFRSLIKSTKNIPVRVTELTGITQKSIDTQGRPLSEVISEFTSFIGDLPLVSFNADLDMNFLGNAAANSASPIQNRSSCARKMAFRAWPDRKSYGLADLAKTAKASAPAAHRVLDDCRQVLSVYVAAASRLGTAR